MQTFPDTPIQIKKQSQKVENREKICNTKKITFKINRKKALLKLR